MGRGVLTAALSTLLAAAAATGAAADEVHLRNGSQITGRVVEDGAEVVLAVAGGTLRFPLASVERIVRAPLPEDVYAARAAQADLSDPAQVRELAKVAGALGLREREKSLARMADEVELERRVDEARDAAGLRDAARFAEAQGLGRAVARRLYERALALAPGDEGSRAELDRLRREERDEERRRAEAEEHARRERDAEERRRLEHELAMAREATARAREEAARERALREAEERQRERDGSVVIYGSPPITVITGRRRRGPVIVPAPGPVPSPRPSK